MSCSPWDCCTSGPPTCAAFGTPSVGQQDSGEKTGGATQKASLFGVIAGGEGISSRRAAAPPRIHNLSITSIMQAFIYEFENADDKMSDRPITMAEITELMGRTMSDVANKGNIAEIKQEIVSVRGKTTNVEERVVDVEADIHNMKMDVGENIDKLTQGAAGGNAPKQRRRSAASSTGGTSPEKDNERSDWVARIIHVRGWGPWGSGGTHRFRENEPGVCNRRSRRAGRWNSDTYCDGLSGSCRATGTVANYWGVGTGRGNTMRRQNGHVVDRGPHASE